MVTFARKIFRGEFYYYTVKVKTKFYLNLVWSQTISLSNEYCRFLAGIYLFKVLMSLLVTLNRFHRLFWLFHCWLWKGKCWLGWLFLPLITFRKGRRKFFGVFCKYLFNTFINISYTIPFTTGKLDRCGYC